MSTSEYLRSSLSQKRMVENDSVILLERNLNTLKTKFYDLESKLKQNSSHINSLKHPTVFEDNLSYLSQANIRLSVERENLEKKAITKICENARLEEKVSDYKIRNHLLNETLEKELSLNQKVIHQNLELKNNSVALGIQNNELSKKLDEIRKDIDYYDALEKQRHKKHLDLQDKYFGSIERNKLLTSRVEVLDCENLLLKEEINNLSQSKLDLLNLSGSYQKRISDKEVLLMAKIKENEELEKRLADLNIQHEYSETNYKLLELEKKNLEKKLAHLYVSEEELLKEISEMRSKVAFLESQNKHCMEQILRMK